MPTTDEAIIATITACMRTANHPGAQIPPGEPGHNEALWNEAQVAKAKAAKLMMKHDIDSASFVMNEDENDTAKRIVIINVLIEKPGQVTPDMEQRLYLCHTIATFYDCRTIVQTDSTGTWLNCMGFESDTRLVEPTMASLSLMMTAESVKMWVGRVAEITAEIRAAHPRFPDDRVSEEVSERMQAHFQSFSRGFLAVVRSRFDEMKRARKKAAETTEAGGHSMSLVLASKENQVQKAYEEQFGRNLGSYHSGRRSMNDGAAEAGGRRAATTADLGGARFGSGASKALGR